MRAMCAIRQPFVTGIAGSESMITQSKCWVSVASRSLKRCEPRSSAGLGGMRPADSTHRFGVDVLRTASLAFEAWWALPGSAASGPGPGPRPGCSTPSGRSIHPSPSLAEAGCRRPGGCSPRRAAATPGRDQGVKLRRHGDRQQQGRDVQGEIQEAQEPLGDAVGERPLRRGPSVAPVQRRHRKAGARPFAFAARRTR